MHGHVAQALIVHVALRFGSLDALIISMCLLAARAALSVEAKPYVTLEERQFFDPQPLWSAVHASSQHPYAEFAAIAPDAEAFAVPPPVAALCAAKTAEKSSPLLNRGKSSL